MKIPQGVRLILDACITPDQKVHEIVFIIFSHLSHPRAIRKWAFLKCLLLLLEYMDSKQKELGSPLTAKHTLLCLPEPTTRGLWVQPLDKSHLLLTCLWGFLRVMGIPPRENPLAFAHHLSTLEKRISSFSLEAKF